MYYNIALLKPKTDNKKKTYVYFDYFKNDPKCQSYPRGGVTLTIIDICTILLVPQFRTVKYGLRGFSISGPRLWNTLPHDIRQSVGNLNLFKNKLKTYFFQLQQRH